MPEHETLPGSPQPADPFEPHMPDVDLLPDMSALFVKARSEVAAGGSERGLKKDQRCLGVVTPGRMVMFVPAPLPASVPAEHVAQVKRLLPSEGSLNITVIGYTRIEPLTKDIAKCMPLLGQLLGFAYLGHNVIVFEGHSSALEYGLQNTDVLIVDSAMLPFLQSDWAEVAFRVLHPGGKVLVQDRKSRGLRPVIRSTEGRGWRYAEPDGEASYVNCLLTTLAKGPAPSVQVVAGRPLPNLRELATDPQQLAWIAELPFRYEALDADQVISILQKVSGSSGVLKAQLATGGGQRQAVSFRVTALTDADGRKRVEIAKDA